MSDKLSHLANEHKSATYTGIQALRFVAALMVVVSHSMSMAADHGLSDTVPRWITGHAGVDIFFVISGFVMYLSFEPLAIRDDGWRVFLRRRLIRIVPLYWMALTLKVAIVRAAPAFAVNSKITISYLIASYFFLPALAPAGVPVSFMPVGWTLNYEMFFYALCTAALLTRISPFLFTAIVLSGLVAFGLLHSTTMKLDASYTNPIVIEFILGMAVARLVGRLPRAPAPSYLAMILIGFMAMCLANSDPIQSRPVIWGVPAALIVFGTASLEDKWRQFLPRLLLMFGDSSYALYLVHTFVVPMVGLLLVKFGGFSPWIVVPACASVSVGLSVAVHQRVESPISAWLKRTVPS
jgi:peptidoglycan/LPS O-acetylase OafA/YrhL